MFVDINGNTYNARFIMAIKPYEDDGVYKIKYRIQNGAVIEEEFPSEEAMLDKIDTLTKLGKKDPNLLPENIKKGITIFGIEGIYEGVVPEEEYNYQLATAIDILGDDSIVPIQETNIENEEGE